MADRIVKVLTPADSFELMSLEEAKTLLGISKTDTSKDEQLAMFITINSATVMRMCNRIFAREEVREEWRELNGGHRIFPSHWPIYEDDIESVESPGGTVLDPGAYELEEASGKIEVFGAAFAEPIIVTYWGGYDLPEDAPPPLKQAVALLNVQSKLIGSLGSIAGIRSLSHKEARVQFHDPSQILNAAFGGANSATGNAVRSILSHYIRYEV
jgi:hypothetical protein